MMIEIANIKLHYIVHVHYLSIVVDTAPDIVLRINLALPSCLLIANDSLESTTNAALTHH